MKWNPEFSTKKNRCIFSMADRDEILKKARWTLQPLQCFIFGARSAELYAVVREVWKASSKLVKKKKSLW